MSQLTDMLATAKNMQIDMLKLQEKFENDKKEIVDWFEQEQQKLKELADQKLNSARKPLDEKAAAYTNYTRNMFGMADGDRTSVLQVAEAWVRLHELHKPTLITR